MKQSEFNAKLREIEARLRGLRSLYQRWQDAKRGGVKIVRVRVKRHRVPSFVVPTHWRFVVSMKAA